MALKAAERWSPIQGVSWEEWQQMLLGLMHGAQMIDSVVQEGKKKCPAAVPIAEADRDAILRAYLILKDAESVKIRPKAGVQ